MQSSVLCHRSRALVYWCSCRCNPIRLRARLGGVGTRPLWGAVNLAQWSQHSICSDGDCGYASYYATDRVDIRCERLERAGGGRVLVDDVAAPLEEAPNRCGRRRHQGSLPRNCGRPELQRSDYRTCLNLVFMNADILLLGAMTSISEVGRYSAACKPLYIIFTGFWLLTDALYPHLAKVEAGAHAYRILLVALVVLATVASAAALGIGLLAPQILTLIYGSTLGAAGLFRILLIALPIDFCFSLLWTVLVSRGYERPVLYSLGAAATLNVFLNLVFIPRFQANAAAWATVASYALLFSALMIFVLKNKVLSSAPASEAPETSAVWA